MRCGSQGIYRDLGGKLCRIYCPEVGCLSKFVRGQAVSARPTSPTLGRGTTSRRGCARLISRLPSRENQVSANASAAGRSHNSGC